MSDAPRIDPADLVRRTAALDQCYAELVADYERLTPGQRCDLARFIQRSAPGKKRSITVPRAMGVWLFRFSAVGFLETVQRSEQQELQRDELAGGDDA